jgi:uncharacterized surface protein with fasciclin (FAS1) repeats
MDLLKRTKLAVALTALAFALAACGGGGTSATDTAEDATTEAADAASEMDSSEMASEDMDESEMASEMESEMDGSEMASEGMSESALQLPADGQPGSLSAMATQPAGTAASTNPVLTTLTAAVTQAGLVDTLNGPGPFTIFAPVDDAFAKIPAADLQALLADNPALTNVLTYHVVAGQKLEAADLAELDSVETVNEGTVTLAAEGDTLMVNGQASVVMADIQVANGVVHLIDGVLAP